MSDEEFVKEISTGLFDSDGDLFRNTLLITSTCAVTAVVLGLCFEAVRRIRGRAKVQQDKSESQSGITCKTSCHLLYVSKHRGRKGTMSRYFLYSSLYHFFTSSELKHVNETLSKGWKVT